MTTIVVGAAPGRARRMTLSAARRVVADRRVAAVVALGVGFAGGLGTDLFAARGATTATQGLLIMAVALAVGVAAGALARTRWILVPLAVAYIVGVELGRIDLVGPSLAFRFDNVYGILAFALARGLHGLLAFLPLTVGVLVGIGAARRAGWLPAARRRPVGTSLLGAAVVALAVLVAWPASTPPVLGSDGQPIPGSIAELATVNLGGVDQSVMIRAADPDKPVLLYLAGGPGQSDIALVRAQVTELQHDFVFVALDQRGNGKSYPAIDPVSSMTIDRAVADVIELTEYLRTRFDEQKVYLLGESWGTILGVLSVQQRPDLYHAWIGSGQMADIVETDRIIYADLVAYSQDTGNTDLEANLAAIGEPPYADIPWANSNLLTWYDYIYAPYTPSAGYMARGEAAGLDNFGIFGSEYSFVEKAGVLRGLMDTFALIYPQLYEIDLRETASRLEVPVWVLDGAAELQGRRNIALEWFDGLDAPSKQLVTYENAAHATAFEQGDDVLRLLTEVIVPSTYAN